MIKFVLTLINIIQFILFQKSIINEHISSINVYVIFKEDEFKKIFST